MRGKMPLCIVLTIILPALILVSFKSGSMMETKRWIISQNSNLTVNGSTNINKFTCDIPQCDQTDTLWMTKVRANKTITLSGAISLKIQSFDCHNSIMTHDLRNTLKEKQFPRLQINFLTLSELPDLTLTPKPITGFVNIELAGVSKRFEVSYQVSVDSKKCIHLLGTREVNFSDFNLTPPRKLGGMIKTNNKLSVQFHLQITALDEIQLVTAK